MAKISVTGFEARKKAFKGMEYVADSVMSTVGPYGLNFFIEKGNKSTNDGVTIGNELASTIKDEFERRGALFANIASNKTNDEVGDATSTTWGLTKAIAKEAERFLPNEKTVKAKKTPHQIISEINSAKDFVLKSFNIKNIESKEELIQSALVSVEDEVVAKLIGSMQWDLGPEGRIIAEEVNDTECSIERVTGIRLDNGFGASHLITNPEKNSLEVVDKSILLTNYTIGKEELMLLKDSIFKSLVSQKKFGVIIVARAFTSEAIKMCQESAQAGFPIFPINAPYVNQKEIMKDIQTVVGGKYIDNEESNLADMYITDIGFCKRLDARISDATVTGVDNEQSQKRKEDRIEYLKKALIGEKSDFGKRMLEERIAQLDNGFAILKIGSQNIANRKRLKDKADDAVNSTRLAFKGGTVLGAGQEFKRISDLMDDENILKRPLLCVYNQIIDSAPDNFEIQEWVRDPYLVLLSALKNACDTAGVFVSVNGVIAEENPKKGRTDDEDVV